MENQSWLSNIMLAGIWKCITHQFVLWQCNRFNNATKQDTIYKVKSVQLKKSYFLYACCDNVKIICVSNSGCPMIFPLQRYMQQKMLSPTAIDPRLENSECRILQHILFSIEQFIYYDDSNYYVNKIMLSQIQCI